MTRFISRSLTLAALAIGTGSCAQDWEHASVTIAYETKVPSEAWRYPQAGRKDVEAAFKLFAETSGYKCRPNFKHSDELLCTGPKDLHLSFKPALNKPEFIATFSWIDSSDRTHAEFFRLVGVFREQMNKVAGNENVLLHEQI